MASSHLGNATSRRLRWLAALAVAVTLGSWLIYNWYRPTLLVDVQRVARGTLEVTIQEDGKTKIRDRYLVSSPLTGKLVRIQLEAGDHVQARATLAAIVRPTEPALLDLRQKMQAEALAKAAQLRVEQTKTYEAQMRAQLDLAEMNFGRLSKLGTAVSQQEVQEAETQYRTQLQLVASASIATQIAEFEWQQAQAALLHVHTEADMDEVHDNQDFMVYSPVDGQVLRVLQESAAIIQAGTPLMELGDPSNLEVEVDVLSNQAVRIAPGNPVLIDQWGGEQPLNGIVRRVEPSGFTKVSSLGVEEQRVNVLIDLVESHQQRSTLGDAYRVEVQITVWKGDDVLQVPSSALFRTQGDWCAFVVQQGSLIERKIQVGRRSRTHAQVLSGLEESELVVVHPTDQLTSGIRVQVRDAVH